MIIVTKVLGKEKVLRNLELVQTNIANCIPHSLSEAAYHLRDTAIEFLKSQSKQPGLSNMAGDLPITDPTSWYIEPIKENTINLICNSKHAAIVEFGGEGRTILSTDYGWIGFPIGKQQGLVTMDPDGSGREMFRRGITLQAGYHYLENSFNSPDVQNNMLLKFKERMAQSYDRGL